jgi:hypothetical protein
MGSIIVFLAVLASVKWTPHRPLAAIQYVRVDHGGLHILVPQEFLNDSDIVALLQAMCREAMAKGGQLTGFCKPTGQVAALTAFCKLLSLTCWRRMISRRGLLTADPRKDIVPDPGSVGA